MLQRPGFMVLPEMLEEMLSGPGRLRFILQPLVALLLGIRDGRQDAAAGRAPYVLSLLVRGARREQLLGALATLTKPLILAVLIDMVVQYLIFRSVHIWHGLLAGTLLIALPYVLARGVTNRIVQRRGAQPRG